MERGDEIYQFCPRVCRNRRFQRRGGNPVLPHLHADGYRPVGAERVQRPDKAGILADHAVALVAKDLAGKLDCLLTARNNDSFVTEGVPGGARSADPEDFPLAFGDCTPERLVAFGYAVLQGGGGLLREQIGGKAGKVADREGLRGRIPGGEADCVRVRRRLEDLTDGGGTQVGNLIRKNVLHDRVSF